MGEGFFDHFFYWVFVVSVLLTAIDWWIGPDGRAAARERMGLWWLHVTQTSFAGLAAEDAMRVERWLRRVFGESWLGLRAVLLCTLISLTVSLALLAGNWAIIYAQADLTTEAGSISLAAGKMLLGYEATIDDIVLPPDEAGSPDADLQLMLKEQTLRDLRAAVSEMRPLLSAAATDVLLPLALVNAFFDWVSLGFTLLLLGWMARSVTILRLAGLVVLDLTVAVLLAGAVALIVGAYAVGPQELFKPWLADFDTQVLLIDRVILEFRQISMSLGVWEGLLIIPILVLFTCALPTLVHLAVALVFLCSKLFRPVLQPAIGRVLYLFHVSRQGVLTQLAIGGGIVAKAVQESIKYFGT